MLHIQIHNYLLKEGFNQKVVNKFLKEYMQLILKYNNSNWTIGDWAEVFKTWNDKTIAKNEKRLLIQEKHHEKVFGWLKKNEHFASEKKVRIEDQELHELLFEFNGKGVGILYISNDFGIWDWNFENLNGKTIEEFGELDFEFAKIIISYNEFLTDPQIVFV